MQNHTWLIDVLDDLSAFAELNGFDSICTALTDVRHVVSVEIDAHEKGARRAKLRLVVCRGPGQMEDDDALASKVASTHMV